jgi:polysaccharide biosynthesis protein PelD
LPLILESPNIEQGSTGRMSAAGRYKSDTGFLPVLPPRFALVELFVFAALIICEFQIEAFPDLTRLNPHPYWIAVLLLSLQYGTVSGLLAAALAIGGTLLIGLPEAEIGESYFNYLVRVWTQPVLWIVVALLLGTFRMRQIEERDGLQQQVDDAVAQAASLSGYTRQLKSRLDSLERRLAASAKPETGRLLEAFHSVSDGRTSDQQIQAARTALSLAFPTASLSLLAADGGGFRQILAHNWPVDATWRTDLRPDDALARHLMAERRIISILHAADDAVLGRDAKIIVPIATRDGIGIAGALRVDQMAAGDLDHRVTARLDAVARALAPLVSAVEHPLADAPPAVVSILRRVRGSLSHVGAAEPVNTMQSAVSLQLARPPIEPGS